MSHKSAMHDRTHDIDRYMYVRKRKKEVVEV